MMKQSLLAVFAAAFFHSASADVYKWTDEAGQVHYGDVQPKAAEAQRVPVEVCATAECRARQEQAYEAVKREYEALADEFAASRERTRLQILANDGRIAVGMSKRLVRQAWGAPSEVKRQAGRSGASEVWVYAGRSGAKVTFDGRGLVKGVRY